MGDCKQLREDVERVISLLDGWAEQNREAYKNGPVTERPARTLYRTLAIEQSNYAHMLRNALDPDRRA